MNQVNVDTATSAIRTDDERVAMLVRVLESSEVSAVVCVDTAFKYAVVPDEIADLGSQLGSLKECQITDRLLDLIDPTEHTTLVRAFGIAKRTGMSGCRARFSRKSDESPGEEVSLRMFDLE